MCDRNCDKESKERQMARLTKIICPHCKKDTGYTQEQFQSFTLTEDIECPYCMELLIKGSGGYE
jgi:ribosomal protein S27E